MFGQFDQDGSGKVKVSELGPMADSIIRAVDGVDSKDGAPNEKNSSCLWHRT